MAGKPNKAILSNSISFVGVVPYSLRKALSKLSSEQQAIITRGLEYPIGCLDLIKEELLIEDERQSSPATYGELQEELDEYQKDAAMRLIEKDNGYLVCPPASGKTLMALYIAKYLGVRTLVVTHRVELAKQFGSMAAKSLKIIPGLVSGKDRIDGKQITVAVAQSIVNHPLNDVYGMMIFDESHHVSTSTMTRILAHYSAKYKYGITASLSGSDDREKLFPFILGNHIVEVTIPDALGRVNLPCVVPRDTGCAGAIEEFGAQLKNFENFENKDLTEQIQRDRILRFRLFTFLCGWVNRESRNAIIVSDVNHFLQEFQSVAVLTSRKKHAEQIAKMLEKHGVPVFTCIGKIKKSVLGFFKMFGGVLVGTESLLAEGIDIPSLEILCLASPAGGKGKVTQRVGRLMRGGGMKYLVDYIDQDEYSKTLFFARRNTYKKMGLTYRKIEEVLS